MRGGCGADRFVAPCGLDGASKNGGGFGGGLHRLVETSGGGMLPSPRHDGTRAVAIGDGEMLRGGLDAGQNAFHQLRGRGAVVAAVRSFPEELTCVEHPPS